jgi:hypothetical protein
VTSVVQLVAVALLAVLGAGWDLARRRVPNFLTFGAAAAGIVYFAATDGTSGLTSSLGGCAIGFGLSVPLFAVGALGAGDVKFLAAFGAWLGPAGALAAALWAAQRRHDPQPLARDGPAPDRGFDVGRRARTSAGVRGANRRRRGRRAVLATSVNRVCT